MIRVPNTFYDPATGASYPWPINHETEEGFGQERAITTEANTANTGLVRVQGDRQPMQLRLSGKMLTRAQRDAFWDWFNRCETRTIHYSDVEGNTFEVQITAYNPVRVRAERNLRDLVNAPTWIYTYTMAMDVIRVVSGPLAGLVAP